MMGRRGQVDSDPVAFAITDPKSIATGTSWLCVMQPYQRLGQVSSGGQPGACDGTFASDWNAFASSHPDALGAPFAAGSYVWAQAWYRDPPAPQHRALSDALWFVLAP